MRILLIPAVLVLTLSLALAAAVAGEKPVPGVSQRINDTQLDQCKGRVGDPANYSQVSRTLSTTQQVSEDTVNFSQNVVGTMKGYNTNPPTDPAIGPGGPIGPNQNIGPTWARGQDITQRR